MLQADPVNYSSSRYQPYLHFWKSQLVAYSSGFHLQSHNLVPLNSKVGVGSLSFSLETEMFNQLLELSEQRDTGIFACMLAAYGLLLKRYENQAHVVIDSPIFKQKKSTDSITQLRVPLLFEISEQESFKVNLNALLAQLQRCYQYQDYPLEILANGESGKPFRTNVLLQYSEIHQLITEIDAEHDLQISLTRKANTLQIKYTFQQDRFETAFVENLHKHLLCVLRHLPNLDVSLTEIDLLSEEEKTSILKIKERNLFSVPQNDYLLHRLFETQAHKSQAHTALKYKEKTLSYEALNDLSDKLAWALIQEYNIQLEDRVALMIEEPDLMLIAMLGVLKSGAAFVPIDVNYPDHRKKHILQDAEPALLISQAIHLYDCSYYSGQLFSIDLQLELLEKVEKTLPNIASPQNLAYIIYTSGSTGNPKGVGVEHRSIVNTLLWRKNYYQFGPEDICLQMFSYVFDGALTDSLTILISGGSLILPDENRRKDLLFLAELIQNHAVSHFLSIPSQYKLLLEQLTPKPKQLKAVTVVGEATHPDLVTAHYDHFPQVKLYNEYGPTENAVCSTIALLQKGKTVTIGEAIDNTSILILNEEYQIQPIGIIGEIGLTGIGLAREYIKLPELTAQKFIAHPYFEDKKERLYLSGDLGRRLHDGNIEFIGRKDQQVKIRGFRIELREIEKALLEHDGIQHAFVLKKSEKSANDLLIAYVKAEKELSEEDIKKYLKRILPEYMIPHFIIVLQKLPFTSNGKIDIASLPNPLELSTQRQPYLAPQSVVEKFLVTIWEEVLGAQNIGLRDNFFKLGGDSIKAVQIAARLHKCGFLIEVKEIFKTASLQELALLTQKVEEASSTSKPGTLDPYAGISNEDMEAINARLK